MGLLDFIYLLVVVLPVLVICVLWAMLAGSAAQCAVMRRLRSIDESRTS
jgi:hypothetical protein